MTPHACRTPASARLGALGAGATPPAHPGVTDGPELVVMTGLQASGKSSWVLEHLAATHEVVSKDHWPNARRREARQARVVAELLAAGCSVVVDNTNPAPAERAPLIRLARAAGVPVRAVWVDTPLEVCLARNELRDGRARVPPVGVLGTRKRFVPPSEREGFDRVDEVRTALGSAGVPGGGDVRDRPPR